MSDTADINNFGYQQNPWHLEKGVSISIILVLLAQIASGIWFASKITSQVADNTQDIVAIKSDMKENEKVRSDIVAKLSSMDQGIHDIREMMFQQPQRPAQLVVPMTTGTQPPVIVQQAPSSEGDAKPR